VVTEFKDGEGRVVCEAEQTIVVQRRAGS
jgi:hypothetical protein